MYIVLQSTLRSVLLGLYQGYAMNTADEYLDGFQDIAELIDDGDDEMWERYLWTILYVGSMIGIEVSIDG